MDNRLGDPFNDIATGGGPHQPGNSDALPAFDQHLRERQCDDQRAVELGLLGERRGKYHRRRTIRPDPNGVRGFPFLFAHVKVIVTRRTSPVYARRCFTRNKAAVLPEILARSGAPATVQAVDHGGSDPTRFQNQARHRRRQCAACTYRMTDGRYIRPRGVHSTHPSRAFSRPTTPWIVSPSARAANVSAMRCSSTGSASATTSSIDGA